VLLKISWGTIWNLGHLLGTLWEHDGNTLGMRKKQKIPPPHPSRRKNWTPSWVHAEPSHWLHETFISNTVCQHFSPGLLAGAQTVGHSSKMKSCCRHSSPWKVVIRVGLPLTNYSIVWWQKGFMCTFLFAQPHYLWKKLALNSCKCRELMWMEIKPECFCTLYNQFLRYANRNLRAWWGK
jgi:hypothetical protein